MGDTAKIEADVYYDGQPTEGVVTFNAQGVPTFTPNASA